MKIGLVCPYNIQKGGGVQECVLAVQAELKKRGHEVAIITPRPAGQKVSKSGDIRLVGRAKDVKSPFATTAQISVSVKNEELDELLREEKFDILHFHEPWVPILSWQILARSKAKNIATFHAKMPDTVISKTIEKIITPYTKSILKYLSVLTAVSSAAAEYVQSITEDNILIIPNGIDLQKYKKISKNKKKSNTVLYIGRLEKRKGVEYLLSAFALLKESNKELRLVIAGDGPDRTVLEEQAKRLGLLEVEFLGYVSEQEKLRLITESDVMTSPALYGESFGIVLLEAMAAGVPIVAGDNPGYSSVLQGYGRVSLVNPKDTKKYAECLNTLLTNDEIRQKWLTWASEYIRKFDYPKVVEEYEKLYEEVLKR